jgi:HAD superfamily hydrolase (TIGR01509 family)
VIPAFPVYLFDIDGTLLDSAEDICGAVQQVLPAETPQPITFPYLKSFIGRHLFDLFGEVSPGCTQEQLDEMLARYRTIYLARGHSGTKVYPGVAEGLAALGGRKGTATTKGSPTTRAILEQFGLIQHFDHVQGTDGFPCKPAPDVIFTALEAMQASPAECLFVGDSAADMEAGQRAGVKTCAVSYGYGKREDLARFTPDYWIDDLRELSQAGAAPSARARCYDLDRS